MPEVVKDQGFALVHPVTLGYVCNPVPVELHLSPPSLLASHRYASYPYPTVATARRSGALTPLPLPDQLLDRARQRRLEVDQLRPRRGHDDPDHAVVERADLGLPLDSLLGRHLVRAVDLEVLVRDAVDDVQLGPTADQQEDRKSTRLNSSHANISYAVFCLQNK